MKRILLIVPILMAMYTGDLWSQQARVSQVRLVNFDLQSSVLIKASGAELSDPDFKSPVYWFPVKVPCTVLTGLVANKVYPDPYSGLNNMLIPDASDEFNKQYKLEQYSHLPNNPNPWKNPYWYRTTFNIPGSDNGKHFQLIFKGINYRAAVWANGKQIADSTLMAGMFGEYSLDISGVVKAGAINGLAVKIYPLDYPGLPATEQLQALGDFYANGGPNGDIGKNVTMLCSVGWDWVPPARDRNMGIWLPVYLRTSGGVTINHPKLVTDLPGLPDTSLAKLSLKLNLVNHNKNAETGILSVTYTPENFSGVPVTFTKAATVAANGIQEVNLTSENIKELNVNKPALWWPNGQGKANLYKLRLRFSNASGVLDDTTFLFGIRTVSSKAVNVNGTSWRRDFYVNGRRIHIVGGAWVPDMMLNRDSLRYDYEMHLCRNANLNLVRIWGGGVTPCDEFFEAADRYGLLVWSDFWITGDTQGEFKGSPDWPLEGGVFRKNVTSTVYRIRNHPSLLVWTGGNEGHARKELYEFMRNSVIELDGTRPFIPCSSGFANLPAGWPASWPDNLPGGVYSGGPYTWQDPTDYYKRAIAAKDWVFKDETGIPSMVTWDNLPKIIPNLVWDQKSPFPLNSSWGYHDACSGNGHWEWYYNEMVKRYGEPVSMEDFCNKMQLMNAIGYQGIFEAAEHKLNDIGGVMLWKLNAAFPSVVWQIYDWYLQPNAGYYFMQNACEPVHIQLNLSNHKVMVINKKYSQVTGLKANVEIFDLDSKPVFRDEVPVSMGPSDVKETTDITSALGNTKGVSLVMLTLKDQAGKDVSRNIYWLAADNNYKALNSLATTSVDVSLVSQAKVKGEYRWSIKITNNSSRIAFFVRPQIMQDGSEVLPTYWSAGYISLAPGETLTLKAVCPARVVGNGKLSLKVAGWNTGAKSISLLK